MFDRPEIMRLAQELAAHANARQSQIARNVANADTPGYRARDVVPFEQIWSAGQPGPMKTSRPGHAPAQPRSGLPPTVIDARTEPSPNGNSVSIEVEMLKQADVRHAHETALAVYRTSLDMMRSVIGRGR